MAIDTGRIREMASPMTFRTQVLGVTADQKESVGRSMGHMTGAASFNLLGEVFINPGASLLRMAFKTSLIFGNDARLPQAGPFTGSVRGMAVRVLQGSLEYFMRVGKIEF